jgi:polyhydroxyalkanoate synthesis regulator phasin
MFGIRRKAAIAITTTILGTALLGGAALAAFAPASLETELVPGLDTTPSPQAGQPDRADAMKKILDALVAKNVITQAQEDAILAALKGDRTGEELLRRVLGALFDQTVTYLGTNAADLRSALPGTSLGAIADKTAGKSRAGLVTALTNYANGAIDKAAADAKITAEQATKAKQMAPEQIAKFVDHAYPAKTPRTVTPKGPKGPQGPKAPKAPRVAPAPTVQNFIGDATTAARDYLGLSATDVATGLRSGKSLGEIADGTPGKTRTGLIATVTLSTSAKIDKAVADGKLTADQATTLKATVLSAVTTAVDRKAPAKATTP